MSKKNVYKYALCINAKDVCVDFVNDIVATYSMKSVSEIAGCYYVFTDNDDLNSILTLAGFSELGAVAAYSYMLQSGGRRFDTAAMRLLDISPMAYIAGMCDCNKRSYVGLEMEPIVRRMLQHSCDSSSYGKGYDLMIDNKIVEKTPFVSSLVEIGKVSRYHAISRSVPISYKFDSDFIDLLIEENVKIPAEMYLIESGIITGALVEALAYIKKEGWEEYFLPTD